MAYRTLTALGSIALVLALDRRANAQVCGDDAVTGDEACDDGNLFGGDGCAANCTVERDLLCGLAEASNSTIQSRFFEIPLALNGQVVLTVGGLRTSAPQAPVPFVFRTAFIAPSMVPGIAIACTTVAEAPGWGPGNAGGGVIDCGAMRLDGVDVAVTIDAGQPSPAPVAVRSGSRPVGSAIFELGLAN